MIGPGTFNRVSALRPDHLDRPHPQRLADTHRRFAEVMASHRQALLADQPSYRDPITGYDVFTVAHLAEQGECCDNGCRHCPFVI